MIKIVGWLKSLFGELLASLGLSLFAGGVSYVGLNKLLDGITAAAGALPPEMLSVLTYLRVFECVSIILTGVAFRATTKAISIRKTK